MTSPTTSPTLPGHNAELYFSGNPYERENLLMGERYAECVLEACAGCEQFLELGIGFGKTVERLSRKIPRLTVIDAEPRLIEEYQPRYPSVTFVRKSFEEFSSDEQFDGVGMGFVLDLVRDPLALLRQYAGLLKPRGRMFVCVGNARSLHRLIAHEAGLLADIKQMSAYNQAYGHQCYNAHDEWLALFAEAGLNCTASRGLYLKPFSTGQLESLGLPDTVLTALSRVARDLPAIANASVYLLEV